MKLTSRYIVIFDNEIVPTVLGQGEDRLAVEESARNYAESMIRMGAFNRCSVIVAEVIYRVAESDVQSPGSTDLSKMR